MCNSQDSAAIPGSSELPISDIHFNLIDEPWIPVLWRNGTTSRVGIKKALTEAGKIRQIAASNPMDNVSLLRFLLAVLQWCKPELSEAERGNLNSDGGGIPLGWLGKLNEHEKAFNLLGDGKRFYQDESVPQNNRPIGDLLVEFPTETKSVHFRHVRDNQYGLCPACCAVGIIRFCGWANAYGGGRYTSAVNGPTPAYAVLQSTTLLKTFAMNWTLEVILDVQPPWLDDEAPTANDLNTITVFAWRSRRLWLGKQHAEIERCAYCGQESNLIKQHAFTGNWKPPFETKGQQKKFWDKDPHLVLEEKTVEDNEEAETSSQDDMSIDSSKKKKDKPKVLTTLGFPSPGSSTTVHTRFWRRALRARLTHSKAIENPMLIAGPAANKGLYQDATAINLPPIDKTTIEATQMRIAMIFSITEQLMGALKRSTPNPEREHPNRKAALDARTPGMEVNLREELSGWLSQAVPDEKTLKDTFQKQFQTVIEAVVSTTTVGSPLRSREAQMRARKALENALNPKPKVTKKAAPPAPQTNTDTAEADNLKRGPTKRKKKEAAP